MDVPDELQEWISLNEEAEIHPNFVGQIDAFKDPNCVDLGGGRIIKNNQLLTQFS